MSDDYGKLEDGLIQAMQALDNQIARAMQRTPAQRESEGVLKWGPYDVRIERITTTILQEIAQTTVSLDSLLVCSQAFSKALYLLITELEREGLGSVRVEYCRDALEKIRTDAERALREIAAPDLV